MSKLEISMENRLYLNLKLKNMEEIYAYLITIKQEIRATIISLIDELNIIRTTRLPLHDRFLYDKIIYHLKDCVQMKPNGHISEDSKYYNDFSLSVFHHLEIYAMQSERLSEIYRLVTRAKAYIKLYETQKKNLKHIVDSLLTNNAFADVYYLLNDISMISERPIDIYDDIQNIRLDTNIQFLKTLSNLD